MAPASPSALLAVPDRPVAERPETKNPDASDGRFAGLMAQFVQPPSPSKTAESAQGSADQVEKEPPQVDASEAQTQAASYSAVSNPPSAPVGPPDPKTAAEATPKVGTGVSQDAPTATARPLPASPVPEGLAFKTLVADTPALPAPSPDTAPRPPQAGSATIQVTAASVELPEGSGPTPPPASLPSRETGTSPIALTASLHVTLPTQPEALVAMPPPAIPQPETVAMPPQAITQAALAEPGARTKAVAKPEGLIVPSEGSQADPALPAGKVKDSTVLPASLGVPDPTPAQTPSPLALPAANQDASFEVGKPSAQPSVRPEPAPATPEILVAKPTLLAQTPSQHPPDGSPLAALGALSRMAETAQPAAPVPHLAAAPPSAPMAQVEGGLRWMLKGGAQEAHLQLHPESLGQVTIHLKVEGGEVHARLWITEPGSVRAVQEGRPHLEQALKEQGLQLGSFDLQQGHRPFQEAPSAPAFREHAAPKASSTRQEAPAAPPPSVLNPYRVEFYA